MEQRVYADNCMVRPIEAEPSDDHVARASVAFLTLFASVSAGDTLAQLSVEHGGAAMDMRLHFFVQPPALNEAEQTFPVASRFGVADVTLSGDGAAYSSGIAELGFDAPGALPDGAYVLGEARTPVPLLGTERFTLVIGTA